MANTKSPLNVVKRFSTGIASSGKCYINLFIYFIYLFIPYRYYLLKIGHLPAGNLALV